MRVTKEGPIPFGVHFEGGFEQKMDLKVVGSVALRLFKVGIQFRIFLDRTESVLTFRDLQGACEESVVDVVCAFGGGEGVRYAGGGELLCVVIVKLNRG